MKIKGAYVPLLALHMEVCEMVTIPPLKRFACSLVYVGVESLHVSKLQEVCGKEGESSAEGQVFTDCIAKPHTLFTTGAPPQLIHNHQRVITDILVRRKKEVGRG